MFGINSSYVKSIFLIIWKSLKNSLKPFFAFQDLARDIFLVGKVVTALGGFSIVLQHKTSFPTTVSF